ncbi:Gfo/Idh/MocA family oxidoreductase [Celeribacter arenosi]|uniref:Gfo/Idh/MocA family oxidoreductase n=1 Tax=Celeribacter arenosi TaxID=792649 RepID=A0ABP7JTY4_9RHOB
MSQPLRFGVLGAANFALSTMARAIHEAEGAKLVALATSNAQKAEPFKAFCPDLVVFESYDALLASDTIDAVYIPLPNHLHIEWSLKALDAGKHVLCEKPIALKASDIDALITKRNETGLLAAEGYMIVHHPQWARVREALSSGEIGKLVHVEGVFSYNNRDMGNIRNKAETGGGSIPDIGVYPYGAVRWATGQEPKSIRHTNIRYENGVDTFAEISADFGDFSFHAMTSTRMANAQEMRFHGEDGVITVTCPFNASAHRGTTVEITSADGTCQVTDFTPARQYVLQVQNFVAAAKGEAAYPWTLENARGTQAMIDAVFEADQS